MRAGQSPPGRPRRHHLTGPLGRTAADLLAGCAARADERIALLTDDGTAEVLRAVFVAAIAARGPADPVVLTLRPRRPAFADLPPHALAALLASSLVLDLTTVPWLYSDSFSRFARECGRTGTRLAFVWGNVDALPTLAACPPSDSLAARARRGLAALARARTLRVRSRHETDFVAELADPVTFIGEPIRRPGMIGAPLCMSVTVPFVPGSARGRLAFVGAGRFQGPENRPLRSEIPVRLTIEHGRVVSVAGDHPAATSLAAWFAEAGDDDVFWVMDCNLGFDPRGDLTTADNTVVHSAEGGFMIGIGRPYEERPEGSRRPGYHLDLMLPRVDLDLDALPFIRDGRYTPESGVD